MRKCPYFRLLPTDFTVVASPHASSSVCAIWLIRLFFFFFFFFRRVRVSVSFTASIFGLFSHSCFLSVFAAAHISFPVGLFSDFFFSPPLSLPRSLLLFEQLCYRLPQISAPLPMIYFHINLKRCPAQYRQRYCITVSQKIRLLPGSGLERTANT